MPILLNTLDGKLMAVHAVKLGEETVTGPHGAAPAAHWRIDGDLKRDIWYDAQGVMVKLSLLGEDGSLVTYTLE
jgi:hypothetical protein